MGEYVAEKLIRSLISRDFKVRKAKALLLGFSFKEDCPDTRNTRVIDVYRHLSSYGIEVSIYDLCVDSEDVKDRYGVKIDSELQATEFDAVMLCKVRVIPI